MADRAFRTHYDNLKVTRDASPELIRAAYGVLARKHHPDKNPSERHDDCNRIMQIINQSYKILADPVRRAAHDAWIKEQEALHVETGSAEQTTARSKQAEADRQREEAERRKREEAERRQREEAERRQREEAERRQRGEEAFRWLQKGWGACIAAKQKEKSNGQQCWESKSRRWEHVSRTADDTLQRIQRDTDRQRRMWQQQKGADKKRYEMWKKDGLITAQKRYETRSEYRLTAAQQWHQNTTKSQSNVERRRTRGAFRVSSAWGQFLLMLVVVLTIFLGPWMIRSILSF